MKYAGAKLPLKPLKANKEPTFLADAMLGSVARKLRVFGYDTLYMVHTHDNEILRLGMAEDRIILTADKELFKRVVRLNARGILVDRNSELEDIVHILSKAGIKSIETGMDPKRTTPNFESRCTVCNGRLGLSSPIKVREKVPQAIIERHSEFFECSSCGKIYWKGGHFKRLASLAKKINAELALEASGL